MTTSGVSANRLELLQIAKAVAAEKTIDEGLHDGVADISFSAMFRERMKKMPEDRRQQRFDNIGDPKRYDRGKSTFEIGAESPFVKYSVYAFEAAFQNVDAILTSII